MKKEYRTMGGGERSQVIIHRENGIARCGAKLGEVKPEMGEEDAVVQAKAKKDIQNVRRGKPVEERKGRTGLGRGELYQGVRSYEEDIIETEISYWRGSERQIT